MYTIDQKLPASGYRKKEQNEPLVLFSLKERPSFFISMYEWRFNMAVNPAEVTYNAVLHHDEQTMDDSVIVSRSSDITLKIPDEAIDALVQFATNPEAVAIKQEDLFPDISILDGVDVSLDIRSKAGRFRMEDNLFMMTEDDGIIKTADREYQTGIHLIRQAIAQALGEEMEVDEDD